MSIGLKPIVLRTSGAFFFLIILEDICSIRGIVFSI